MTRFVPFDTTYDQIRKLEKSASFLLSISALMIMANWLLSKFFSCQINREYEELKELTKILSIDFQKMPCGSQKSKESLKELEKNFLLAFNFFKI